MTRNLPNNPDSPLEKPRLWGIDGNRTSTNEKGIVLPYVAGHRKLALKWISPTYDYWTRNIREKVGKKTKTVAKEVYCSIVGAICLGPIDRINKIYFGGDVIWSSGYQFYSGQESQIIHTSKGVFHFYRGNPNQNYDGYLSAKTTNWSSSNISSWSSNYGEIESYLKGRLGHNETITNYRHPRYPSVAYVIGRNISCGRNSTTVPNIEVSFSRSVQTVPGISVETSLQDNGCNPVAILAELLHYNEAGVELPLHQWDLDRLNALGSELANDKQRYYLSVLLDSQQSADKVIKEILTHIDGFQATRSGKFSLGYFPKDGVIPTVTSLSIHDMTKVPKMNLPDWSKTSNRIVVKYPYKTIDFENDTVDAKSTYNRKIQEKVVSKTLETKFIIDGTQATRYANEQVEVESIPEDSGRISVFAHKAINQDGSSMQPGDRFRINYAPWELDMYCRITEVTQKSLGAVNISFIRERGLFAQPYIASSDPIEETTSAEIPPIEQAHIVELTDELSESTGTWLGILAAQPSLDVGGFALWYSSDPEEGQSRNFDSITSSAYWSVKASLSEHCSSSSAEIELYTEESLDDFDSMSTQAQIDDTLLILIGSEVMSVGEFYADPDYPGKYSFNVLRGRKGTQSTEHNVNSEIWIFYREQLVKVTHARFSTDTAPEFKLQSIAVGGTGDLSSSLLISDFSFRDRSSENAQAWIIASDLNFITEYDTNGEPSTTPSEIVLTCNYSSLESPTFQWQRYLSGSWQNISSTSQTHTVTQGNEGRYRCMVSKNGLAIETDYIDINRITEAPGSTQPISCSSVIIDGKQVLGARLPAVSLSLNLSIAGVDGTDNNAASKTDVENAITQLQTAIEDILSRLGSSQGHGLIES